MGKEYAHKFRGVSSSIQGNYRFSGYYVCNSFKPQIGRRVMFEPSIWVAVFVLGFVALVGVSVTLQ